MPVNHFAAGDTRKAIKSATSSGVPYRLIPASSENIFVASSTVIPYTWARLKSGKLRQTSATLAVKASCLYCTEKHSVLRLNCMRTLVLRIPDDLEARLEALASRRGKTKSAIARELLSKGVRSRRKDDLSAFDLIRDQIGIVDTGIGDLASNPKHMQRFGR